MICDCEGNGCNKTKEERYIWETGYHRITMPGCHMKSSWNDEDIEPGYRYSDSDVIAAAAELKFRHS